MQTVVGKHINIQGDKKAAYLCEQQAGFKVSPVMDGKPVDVLE